jgi:hypothetical protein
VRPIEYWNFAGALRVIGLAAFFAAIISAAINSTDGRLPRWLPWAFGALSTLCVAIAVAGAK